MCIWCCGSGASTCYPRTLHQSLVFLSLLRGMTVDDICTAALWSSLCSFIHFYLRDASVFSLTHSVLGVLNDQSNTVNSGHAAHSLSPP